MKVNVADATAAIMSRLQITQLNGEACQFITGILEEKQPIILSAKEIANQDYRKILEILPPMKGGKKRGRQQRQRRQTR